MDNLHDYAAAFTAMIIGYIPRLIKAVLVLIIGIFIIKFFRKFMKRMMVRREDMDPTLIKFLLDLGTWALRVLLFIIVIGSLGVETTSFAAIIAAAGLAIGLSLQGSLSNFAGGVLIVLFKPFRVGDFVEVQGEGGTVSEIQILYTKLVTPSNQVVFIPNGQLANGNIKNYSKEPIRKEELIIGVSYKSNLKHVKGVLTRIVESNEKVLDDPAPIIRIKALADSSVNFQVFVWATNQDFWQMLSDVKETIKEEFDKEGIEIPFPQQDLNIRNEKISISNNN
ncbi:mechanosensitive ion channel family protein [Flavobacterium rhizosphaerae]|uniref:Mechanosensitive ion channel domain-containing protein n=1 Tax=Flavobacterium rhizosphaerae TaxID=3163298 RepID=A0ABW8YVH2_9FLAO